MTTLAELGAELNQEFAFAYVDGHPDALNHWRDLLEWATEHLLIGAPPEAGADEAWSCLHCGQEFSEAECRAWADKEPRCPRAERPGWADYFEQFFGQADRRGAGSPASAPCDAVPGPR